MSPTIITSLFGSILRVGRTCTPPMGTPNGIAELQPVELNGYPQWLLIRGQDVLDLCFSSCTEVLANRICGLPITR